jgi:hypothetical protein
MDGQGQARHVFNFFKQLLITQGIILVLVLFVSVFQVGGFGFVVRKFIYLGMGGLIGAVIYFFVDIVVSYVRSRSAR